MMKKIGALLLCAAVLFGMILAVQAETGDTNPAAQGEITFEAAVLDAIARSWTETCVANMVNCRLGLDIYQLGKPMGDFKETIKKDFIENLRNGYTGAEYVPCLVDVDELCEALNDVSLKEYILTFMTTSTAPENSDKWVEHIKARNNIFDKVKNGKIAGDVDLLDIIKENYVFIIGEAGCEVAVVKFDEALRTTDIQKKRELILEGALFATVACEMSVADSDAVLRNEEKSPEEVMVAVAEAGIDVVSEIVPEIGIFYDTLTITADIGIKALSIQGKVKAINGYLDAPDTVENKKSDFFDAVSNQYGLYTFTIDDYEVVIGEYNGYFALGDNYRKVEVAETVYGFPVTGFSGCFAKGLSITEISIPSGVRTRSLSAVVENCDQLTKIEYNAIACKGQYRGGFFVDCNNPDLRVSFGPGVEMIPERFLVNCGVTAVSFPDGVTTMHAAALMDCENLKMVWIPSTLTQFKVSFQLGRVGVIHNCENLETVYYMAGNAEGSYYGAVLSKCGNSAGNMSIIFGKEVRTIPSTFLENCGVKDVTFPEGVTHIREYAISGCQRLESLTIPSTVTNFGGNSVCDYVFSGCNKLETINYDPLKATSCQVPLFRDIEQDFQINFGEGIEEIPEQFIKNCGITQIEFPEGVKTIRNNCLVNCDLLEIVTVPSTVETIEYNFMKDCDGVNTVYFNANCTSSPKTAMISNCGNAAAYMEVILGSNVTTTPGHFIENCGITEFIYPEGVKIINAYSLVSCSALTMVEIGENVEAMGKNVVSNCSNLSQLHYYAKRAGRIENDSSFVFDGNGVAGMMIWFAGDIQRIPERFMNNCGVENVMFPESLTEIPDRAINRCTGLSSVFIPRSVTTIGDSAFDGCSGLTSIAIPSGITVMRGNTFRNCPDLKKVYITDLAAWCGISFDTDMSNPMYYGAELYLNGQLVTELIIPRGITHIGAYAFSNCTQLTSVTIPVSVEHIGLSAFSKCTQVKTVYYSGTQEQWDQIEIGINNDCLRSASLIVAPSHDCETYGKWVVTKAPTFTSAGERALVCSQCGATLKTQTLEKLVGQVAKWNISLHSDFKVCFLMHISESVEDTAAVVLKIGEDSVSYRVSELAKNDDAYYIMYADVAAVQMNEEISVQVINGSTSAEKYTYTVRQYCDTVLSDNRYRSYHALVKEMLNYGAMAQMYFGHDKENLANDGIADVAAADVPETADELVIADNLDALNFYGASLVYRDRIAVRYYFTGDVAGCTFTANGNTYTPVAKDGMYYIEIADILPQNLDQQITLTVTDSNGNILSVTYGPMNYIVRMYAKDDANLQNLMKALYNYHLAAKALKI